MPKRDPWRVTARMARFTLVCVALAGTSVVLIGVEGDAHAAGPTSSTPVAVAAHYLHDGFYLRLGLGGGAFRQHVDHSADDSWTISGATLNVDLLVGGSPAKGVAAGIGIEMPVAPKPTVDYRGAKIAGDTSVQLLLLGPFVDWYPDPTGGFHMGIVPGLVSISGLSSDGRVKGSSEGVGLSGFVGYDWWTSKDWSIGGMISLLGATTDGGQGGNETFYHATTTAGCMWISLAAVYY